MLWILGIGALVIYTLCVLYLGCLMGANYKAEEVERVNYWKGDRNE